MKYCADTSALLDAWVRWYPINIFPTLWQKIDELIDRSMLIAPDEVYEELSRRDDEIQKWAKDRYDKLFRPIDESLQIEVTQILSQFPYLVDTKPGRGRADPFVIALARITDTIVVTGELPSTSSDLKKARIPNVCDYFGIKWVGIRRLIEMEGWTF